MLFRATRSAKTGRRLWGTAGMAKGEGVRSARRNGPGRCDGTGASSSRSAMHTDETSCNTTYHHLPLDIRTIVGAQHPPFEDGPWTPHAQRRTAWPWFVCVFDFERVDGLATGLGDGGGDGGKKEREAHTSLPRLWKPLSNGCLA